MCHTSARLLQEIAAAPTRAEAAAILETADWLLALAEAERAAILETLHDILEEKPA